MPDHGEQLDRIETEIKTIKTLLTGNGEPSHGLIVRVDRLETFSRQSRWAFRTVIAAALFGACDFFWKLFHRN